MGGEFRDLEDFVSVDFGVIWLSIWLSIWLVWLGLVLVMLFVVDWGLMLLLDVFLLGWYGSLLFLWEGGGVGSVDDVCFNEVGFVCVDVGEEVFVVGMFCMFIGFLFFCVGVVFGFGVFLEGFFCNGVVLIVVFLVLFLSEGLVGVLGLIWGNWWCLFLLESVGLLLFDFLFVLLFLKVLEVFDDLVFFLVKVSLGRMEFVL